MDFWHNQLVFLTITTIIKFLVFVLGFVMLLASVLTWMERRQSAYMQDRLGPWRAYFVKIGGRPLRLGGLIHIAADALKMLFKEPFQPRAADTLVYQIAPAIGFISSLMVISLVPFGPAIHTGWEAPWDVIPLQMVPLQTSFHGAGPAETGTGLLLVLALGSLGVYGASLAGWSSNNRFAMMGGLRAAAQGISYEIALGLTLVGMIMVTGSTDLVKMVAGQQTSIVFGWLPAWGIFIQPLGAMLFLVAAIAETKRAPFDIPEGESEIIGYFVEYSSMAFGMFMLGEFVEVVTLGALFTTLFLGGWDLPWFIGAHSILGLGEVGPWLHSIICMLVFMAKVVMMSSFQLHVRWTLPRFRYDQLMHLGWKILLPLALLNIFITAGLVWWDPTQAALANVGVALIVLFSMVVVAGPRRQVMPAAAH